MPITRSSTSTGAVEWEYNGRSSSVLAVAVHAGHGLSPAAEALTALDDSARLREEDPGTEMLARVAPLRGIATQSRFEVDLNRPRESCVYVEPDDAWGLDLWKERPDSAFIAHARSIHDRFYRRFASKVSEVIGAHGAAVVLDLHSYNHKRNGVPDDPQGAPEVNVGTGSLDRARWGHVVDRFMTDLAAQGLDVRENVRFEGREVAAFVHRRFPGLACCLAIEFKKTYMDEDTGVIFPPALDRLRRALAATLPGLEAEVAARSERVS